MSERDNGLAATLPESPAREAVLVAIAAAPAIVGADEGAAPETLPSSAASGDADAGPDSADGEEAPQQPRALGYDVERLNREYAMVLLGSKAVIYMERADAKLDEQKRFVIIDAFRAWFANTATEYRGADGKIKTHTWAARWIADKRRRSFKGIEFFPNPDGAPSTPNYLNLWSGFACAPRAKPNGYAVFRDPRPRDARRLGAARLQGDQRPVAGA